MSCLSDSDRAMMKLNSSIIIKTILRKLNWAELSRVNPTNEKDEFYRYYFNQGVPKLDFLLEYYCMAHVYHSETGGDDDVNYASEFNEVYEEHKDATCADDWESKHCVFHKMFLLKKDRFWYKRHFRDRRNQFLFTGYDFFVNGKPRVIKKAEIYNYDFDNHSALSSVVTER